MGLDLNPLLAAWPFDPHEVNARLVDGDDGQRYLQIRLELGLLQLALEGRPDGERPRGAESLLDALEADAARAAGDYRLAAEDLDELHREGQQYYKRYLALFQMEWHEPVVRDTERNLRLLEFVRRHARRKKDVWRFDQYRPYLLMMDARARGQLALKQDDFLGALRAIERGCAGIREFLSHYGRSPEDTLCGELDFLLRWRREVQALSVERPANARAGLERQLQDAVGREDYEAAAGLRDQLRRLGEPTDA